MVEVRKRNLWEMPKTELTTKVETSQQWEEVITRLMLVEMSECVSGEVTVCGPACLSTQYWWLHNTLQTTDYSHYTPLLQPPVCCTLGIKADIRAGGQQQN